MNNAFSAIPLTVLENCGSTNDEARTRAQAGEPLPLAVSAVTQTAGRGRRHRPWASPVGGVWLTMAWPQTQEPMAYEAAPLLVGLGVARAVAGVSPALAGRVAVKWPNDVVVLGMDGTWRKLAGVLCERAAVGGPDAITPLLVGIGVNANFTAAQLPTGVRFPATTILEETHSRIDLDEFRRVILAEVGELLRTLEQTGFTDDLATQIDAVLAFKDQPVSFATDPQGPGSEGGHGAVLIGTILGVGEGGRIRLSTDSGEQVLASGELGPMSV